jgi:hypothetical protein
LSGYCIYCNDTAKQGKFKSIETCSDVHLIINFDYIWMFVVFLFFFGITRTSNNILYGITRFIFSTDQSQMSYWIFRHLNRVHIKSCFLIGQAKKKNMCVYGHPTHPIFQPPTLTFFIGNYSTLIFANDLINFYTEFG